jgi:lysozyme family protein
MANYEQALQWILSHEGGYVNDPDDPGGETYKGVARKMNSKWDGWLVVDMLKRQSGFPANLDKDTELQEAVKSFYQINYWDRIKGDHIQNQEVATSIFDFAVNAGVSTSSSLAQLVVGTTQDGVIGNQSIAQINSFDPEYFIASFTVAKIARYISIVKKRPTSKKYFYGWVCRALGEN